MAALQSCVLIGSSQQLQRVNHLITQRVTVFFLIYAFDKQLRLSYPDKTSEMLLRL